MGHLDVYTVHEELEVGHDLVLELLEQFVELSAVSGIRPGADLHQPLRRHQF